MVESSTIYIFFCECLYTTMTLEMNELACVKTDYIAVLVRFYVDNSVRESASIPSSNVSYCKSFNHCNLLFYLWSRIF